MSLPVVPLVPLVLLAPELSPDDDALLDARGEDEPEESVRFSFLAFSVLVFLAFGLVSVVVSLAADDPEEASLLPDDPDEPEVEPEEPEVEPVAPGIGVLDGTLMELPLPPAMPASLPVPAPVPPVWFCDLMVSEGLVALLPLPLLPEALEPELPDEPEEPDEPEVEPVAPGIGVLDGTVMEVPLPPAMPASLPVPAPVPPVWLCDLMVSEGLVALLLVLPDCASAMEDTEATTISDSERRVLFNVMNNSFG